jgi:CRISPR-associated endonuclease/helicase Cas3
MANLAYPEFFEQVTESRPYDYQILLAESDCESRLISVPTGLGKTAAVVLAWLYNRVLKQDPNWPRRLVYCLPMRTLVEQTRDCCQAWLAKMGDLEWKPGEITKGAHKGKVGLHILMGGEETVDWDLYPEENAILIGTQDMLLSRALNRGYGMSRYRWPMHFGLLNNDCLWVLDETQLMGAGLSTACQLEAFRRNGSALFASFPGGQSITWYTSATASLGHLQTREWRSISREESFFFDLKQEKNAITGPVAERLGATKRLKVQSARNFGSKQKEPDAALIREIIDQHRAMVEALQNAPSSIPRRSLVICNTVDRAIKVHSAIIASLASEMSAEVLLMHSRFRPKERRWQAAQLKSEHLSTCLGGQIVVATQVIEAGVDLSSGLLWTEVAPLASIVQRLGRLNRSGEFGFNKQAVFEFQPQAFVLGIEAPEVTGNKDEKAKKERDAELSYLPYESKKCLATLAALDLLEANASPRHLDAIREQIDDSVDRCPYSLQRHELLDFFDSDANLSLGFTDVSPFVRGLDEDTDIQVLWRDWSDSKEGSAPRFWPDYQRDELCSVSISKVKEARSILNQGWIWRGKGNGENDQNWISIASLGDVAPGMTILLPTSAGGYDVQIGWTGRSESQVASCYVENDGPTDDDTLSYLKTGWRSIPKHTEEVIAEAEAILSHLKNLQFDDTVHRAFGMAAPWHDVGKQHRRWRAAAFYALMKAGIHRRDIRKYLPLAKFSLDKSPQLKADDGSNLKNLKAKVRELRAYFRPRMAHEVASALAFRQHEQRKLGVSRDTDLSSLLAEYLIMSHHGHVRKVLRDEIPKFPKNSKDADSVCGILNRDAIRSVEIAGQDLGCTELYTDCRRMGRGDNGHESYTRGVLRLLDHFGPFRLACFEALFRAADIRASIKASQEPNS